MSGLYQYIDGVRYRLAKGYRYVNGTREKLVNVYQFSSGVRLESPVTGIIRKPAMSLPLGAATHYYEYISEDDEIKLWTESSSGLTEHRTRVGTDFDQVILWD